MTGLYGWMNRAEGQAECEIRGVLTASFFNRCAEEQIPVLAAEAQEDYTVRVTLRLRDLERARNIARRSQCELMLLCRRGGRELRRRILRRWVPAACLLCFLALLTWSKLYIWELEVSGNETVSSARILNALSDCGIRPGSFWPGFTSDNLRSELLMKLPELGWATVNIYGSRAEVIVRERIPKPALYAAEEPVDLVSARPGIVTSLRALNGTAMVKPGSAVLPGDVLIAGKADSAFSGPRTLHAVGTVTAQTYYELTAVLPETELVRTENSSERSLWALEIGTGRINFYRNSSICDTHCDKIKKKWQFGIEGLFTLPVALVREHWTESDLQEQPRDANLARQMLEQQLHTRLAKALGDGGTIESEHFTCSRYDGTIRVCLHAVCSEEIAAEQPRTQEE